MTGNLEKAYKTLELWGQTYPRRGARHRKCPGSARRNIHPGDWPIRKDNGSRAGRNCDGARPSTIAYANLALAQFYTDRFPAAESTIQRATARKVQMPTLLLLTIQPRGAKGRPGADGPRSQSGQGKCARSEHWMAHEEALALARSGRLRAARRSSGRAVDLALQEQVGREVAATYIAARAVWEALCGNSAEARTDRHGRARTVHGPGCRIRRRFCLGALGKFGPIRGSRRRFGEAIPGRYFCEIYLRAGPARVGLTAEKAKFADSVERLEITRPYELAANGLNFHGYLILGGLHSAYVRGQAFMAAAHGTRKPRPSFRRSSIIVAL